MRPLTVLAVALLVMACANNTTGPAPIPAAPDAQEAPSPEAPEPIAHVDPPPPAPVTPGPVEAGGACLVHADCSSGICEGEGCGDDTPGVCAPAMRACTRDLRPYCGCDHKTFLRGGNCPGERFAHRGPCPGQPPSPQLPPR